MSDNVPATPVDPEAPAPVPPAGYYDPNAPTPADEGVVSVGGHSTQPWENPNTNPGAVRHGARRLGRSTEDRAALQDAYDRGFAAGRAEAMQAESAAAPAEEDVAEVDEGFVEPDAEVPEGMAAVHKDGKVLHVHQQTVAAHRVAGWQRLMPEGAKVMAQQRDAAKAKA